MKKLKYEEGKEEKLIAKRYIILFLDALKLASNPVPLSLCKFLFRRELEAEVSALRTKVETLEAKYVPHAFTKMSMLST